ncbi:MAG: BMC domain-containing protein [Pirellulaceae bacterium]|nr:BMC domain-containing protein [Pirellulaceae bacterium]
MMDRAVGLLETKGLSGLVVATDAMAKSAHIEVVKRVGIGDGLVTTVIYGDIGSVRTAIDVGIVASQKVGELVGSHVIPRPTAEVVKAFLS